MNKNSTYLPEPGQ